MLLIFCISSWNFKSFQAVTFILLWNEFDFFYFSMLLYGKILKLTGLCHFWQILDLLKNNYWLLMLNRSTELDEILDLAKKKKS